MKTNAAEFVSKTVAIASMGAVVAVGLISCSGTPSSTPNPTSASDRQAGAASYPKMVIGLEPGEINFASRKAKTRKDVTDTIINQMNPRKDGSRTYYRMPNWSAGIQTVNGNNWYTGRGHIEYEVTVWGKDVEKRNGRVHVEGGMNVPNALIWAPSDYRNEFVVEPIMSNGEVTSLRFMTTDKAKIGGGAHRWYDYSIDKTVGVGGNWTTLVDPKAGDHGHMSGHLDEQGLGGVWKFLPKLSVLTKKQSNGTIEVLFKETWNDTFVLTHDNGDERID